MYLVNRVNTYGLRLENALKCHTESTGLTKVGIYSYSEENDWSQQRKSVLTNKRFIQNKKLS